jgi:hypothetical protein
VVAAKAKETQFFLNYHFPSLRNFRFPEKLTSLGFMTFRTKYANIFSWRVMKTGLRVISLSLRLVKWAKINAQYGALIF